MLKDESCRQRTVGLLKDSTKETRKDTVSQPRFGGAFFILYHPISTQQNLAAKKFCRIVYTSALN